MTFEPDIRSWVESDGTEVWLVAESGRGLIVGLEETERRASALAGSRSVFGANAEADDEERLGQLTALGYRRALSMVEMERSTSAVSSRLAPVQVRSVNQADYEAMHELTQVVWAARAYLTMPTLSFYREWVADADPDLMLLAFHEADLVGYIAAEVQQDGMRVGDVQVHPAHQRQGIATELIRRIAEQADRRSCQRVYLETEGDNPAGARTFYERLGFRLAAERLRYRRPVNLCDAL